VLWVFVVAAAGRPAVRQADGRWPPLRRSGRALEFGWHARTSVKNYLLQSYTCTLTYKQTQYIYLHYL
jgi:hypothetical protein